MASEEPVEPLDPLKLREAAVEHLGQAILLVLARFTSPSDDSPMMSEDEIVHHLGGMLPDAMKWIHDNGYADQGEPDDPDEET